MPLYTYHCSNCGVQFDQQQKFTDESLTKCPKCGRKTLHKVYSAVGVVFKGSGFYATDHRSPSGMTSIAEEKTRSESEAAKSEEKTKTESDASKTPEEKKPAKEKSKPAETKKDKA